MRNGLESVTFHHRLGSLYDKTLRLEVLAGRLAQHLGLDSSLSSRAALLCKADLTSDMVGEFPRLQGTMGRYYANIRRKTRGQPGHRGTLPATAGR
ncbi:MAG: hypothetical protein Ct9H300mP16_01300 [Pseudomonadota bacterium]|nr:MAG: hypothetical protein Ct9H300mP16_01300 [Pseudomonadota bacterium]